MSEPVLQARRIVRRFERIEALGGLTLQVAAGEIYGLVGPDGAGKTTAMRAFAGLIGRDEGKISVLGDDPLSNAPGVRAAIGYMPQQYSLYGDLSVEENLRFFSRMFCLDRESYRARRARLLAITRLERFADRRADALSGGMYKKLALACSLLPQPRLLLLDEPTNGVDPVSRRELWSLLFELAGEGMAVLVTTAYMDEAARCHRVGLIHQGRLLLEGEPTRLLGQMEHPTFEASGAGLDGAERAADAHPDVLAISVVGERLRLVVRAGSEADVRAALERAGVALAPCAPDFEDLFLTVTLLSGEQRAAAVNG